MTKKKLFIIGNGFDVYHGINSRYHDFRKYLESRDRDLCEKLKEYFNYDNLWSDFEQSLADFDSYYLIENAEDFLVPYSADKWSDAYHHDYQNEISEVVEALSHTLKSRFTSWVLQLENPSSANRKRLSYIDASALFLTFNYTQTLQRIYAIPDKNVLHIHGKAEDELSNLILGHAWKPSDRVALSGHVDLDVEDPRVTEGNQMIDKYFKLTYKPTSKIIKNNTSFFQSLTSVEEIYVLGHSIAKVDIEYFRQIMISINLKSTKWHVSHYGKDELNRHVATMQTLGMKPNMVHFFDLKNIAANK
jgi:hypothetical protein